MELFSYPIELIWLLAGFSALVFFHLKARAATENLALRLMTAEQLKRLSGETARTRKMLRERLYLSALLALVIAAAGPQWGMELAPITDLKGNLVIAVDTSASMAAKDLKPSRIENARLLINSLADKFPDYRLGIVAFSGEAFVQCPLTTDTDALKYFLSYIAPDMLPVPGTNLAAAVETGAAMLEKYSGQKIIVLITDGEDHSGRVDEVLNAAAGLNLKIFTVGLGKTEGELIPVRDPAGNFKDYKKDSRGKTVVTKLDETLLLNIARKTGAEYIRYGGDPEAAAAEIHGTVEGISLSKSKGFGKARYKNRYQFPLLLALLLLLIELLVMEKGFALPPSLKMLRGFKKTPGAMILLLAMTLAFAPAAARAGKAENLARKGNKAYGRQDFPKAYDCYNKALEKAPKADKILFNRGAAFYRLEDYPGAARDFEDAAGSSKIKSRADYNAGNAYFQLSDFPKAVENYRKAILADPGDRNAKYNLQKALEQIKKQKQDKKKDKQEQKKQCEQKDEDRKKQDKKGDGRNEKEKKEKDKEEARKQEEARRKEAARQQAEKLLELMKEKEKSPVAREVMNSRFMNKSRRKDPPSGKDW
ncbi:MAG: VWA domain-containing protein [Elusimicrobia bacterium]|nr:VWA domain-containing protein [Elusimicrobiota bacterium]